jgi:Fic family protein
MATTIAVEAHRPQAMPWRQRARGGTVEDRKLDEVIVQLPPLVATVDVAVPSAVQADIDAALREVAGLDEAHGDHLASLATLLLRAESVASSKIERIEASMDDYARALHGIKANAAAVSMVASTEALHDLIRSVDGGGAVELSSLLRAHRILMAEDPFEEPYAGRTRDMQNWIGGSDHSPRNAWYVPPPPATVDRYLDDLVTFSNRTDVGSLVQAAVAHAQFESIHPFTDGNGRIGRALINTILRRRGTTRRVVIPLASALVARRDDYFDALTAYRRGDAGPIITSFTSAALITAEESRATADRLAGMPSEWRAATGPLRAGSAASKLVDSLLTVPVFSAEDAERMIGGATSSVYAAINRLEDAGVVRRLTQRTRNQVWVAGSVADELDDLGARVAARARRP